MDYTTLTDGELAEAQAAVNADRETLDTRAREISLELDRRGRVGSLKRMVDDLSPEDRVALKRYLGVP